MKLGEKQISSRQIFDGRVIKVFEDRVSLPNGKESFREVVRHRGAVCVLPLTKDNEVICVRQYRYPHAQVLLEIPAGKLEEGESDILAAAIRELKEETGAESKNIKYLGKLFPSPAIFDEVIHMYLATELSFGDTNPDEDEFLEIERIPLGELVDMVMRGEIYDAKTQACVLRAQLILKEENQDIRK